MLTILAAAVLAASTIIPPPGHFTLDLVTAGGTGCPAGTVAIVVPPDNSGFTVTYSAFLAQVGVGADPLDFRKNCALNLRVNTPREFTYGIEQVEYRGSAHLERGASGLMRTYYYFQGMSHTTNQSYSFKGPFSDDWEGIGTPVVDYLPCDVKRNLNIFTELRVSAGTSDPKKTTSFMSLDTATYRFAWKKCP